jgi:hypothetical protein
MDLVPVGYSLFAMALGIAAGALIRRVLPAMVITLAGFIAVRVVVTLWLRPHYLSAVTAFYKATSGFTPRGAFWQIAQGVVGPNGQAMGQTNNTPYVDNVPLTSLPASCAPAANGPANPSASCMQALSHFRAFITYQPADRFWTFQAIETGIFVALAAALIAVTAVVLLRRDA